MSKDPIIEWLTIVGFCLLISGMVFLFLETLWWAILGGDAHFRWDIIGWSFLMSMVLWLVAFTIYVFNEKDE